MNLAQPDKAAELVQIGQPALSKHISGFDDEVGVALLFQSSKGVQPTEAGERAVALARFLLA